MLINPIGRADNLIKMKRGYDWMGVYQFCSPSVRLWSNQSKRSMNFGFRVVMY